MQVRVRVRVRARVNVTVRVLSASERRQHRPKDLVQVLHVKACLSLGRGVKTRLSQVELGFRV